MKIGIVGIAGAGKDTFAKMLQQELWRIGRIEKPVLIKRYAYALKKSAELAFGTAFDDRDVKDVPVAVTIHKKHLAPAGLEAKLADLAALYGAEVKADKFTCTSSPAQFQQYLGTEVGRAVSETYWMDLYNSTCTDEVYIAPDVRFGNELENSDFNVLIVNPKAKGRPGHVSEAMAEHMTDVFANSTEQEWEDEHFNIQYTVLNAYSLRHLQQQAQKVAHLIVVHMKDELKWD